MDNDEVFCRADKLYEQGDFAEAFSLFSLAAENGDAPSMTRIASMYTCGEGVDCDYDKAIEWELKAIDGGEISAMVNVGISYRIKGQIRVIVHRNILSLSRVGLLFAFVKAWPIQML